MNKEELKQHKEQSMQFLNNLKGQLAQVEEQKAQITSAVEQIKGRLQLLEELENADSPTADNQIEVVASEPAEKSS